MMPYLNNKKDEPIITQILNVCSDLNLSGLEAVRICRCVAANLENSLLFDDYTDFE